jgi:hypothetical protein
MGVNVKVTTWPASDSTNNSIPETSGNTFHPPKSDMLALFNSLMPELSA